VSCGSSFGTVFARLKAKRREGVASNLVGQVRERNSLGIQCGNLIEMENGNQRRNVAFAFFFFFFADFARLSSVVTKVIKIFDKTTRKSLWRKAFKLRNLVWKCKADICKV